MGNSRTHRRAKKEQMPVAQSPGSYSAKDIQVLEGLEAVRKRPSMYIGSTGPKGLHHLVYEVVDNSVDEALARILHARSTSPIHADGSCTVVDNGRGIPVDNVPKYRKPAVEVVLTMLHAGGKFGGEGYKVSGGLHGVGVSVVNALSTRLDVEVKLDGQDLDAELRPRQADRAAEGGRQHEDDRHHRHVLAGPRDLRDDRASTTTPSPRTCARPRSSTATCASRSPTSASSNRGARSSGTRAASTTS